MSNTKKYPVNEIFYSMQGEGSFSGAPAVFVRFVGCNLRCPFCDTQHLEPVTLMSPAQIADAIDDVRGNCRFVVLTGGEPAHVVDTNLLRYLHEKMDVAIAMETNGTAPVNAEVDWVTVSPKSDFVPGAEVVQKNAHEVKVVFDGVHDPAHWLADIRATEYFLQPCDTGDAEKNAALVAACIDYIKENPHWRLSLQVHKIVKIR